MPESADPLQRPEGRLIEQAVLRRNLSVKQLAPLAGISDSRWRQIVKGFLPAGGGRVPVVATARRLALMARAAGVSAQQLRDVGREDAADILETLGQIDPVGGGELSLAALYHIAQNPRLSEKRRESARNLIPLVEAVLRDAEEELKENHQAS